MSCQKEHEMLELEIENCKKNIEFYELQIEDMEDKIEELKKLSREYDYY